MPYTIDKPPEAIEGLPKHLIEIWVTAFNSAFKQYDGDEVKSAATAWTAVKTKFKKEGEKWVAKEADPGVMSDDGKRNLLQTALVTYYEIESEPDPKPSGILVEEVFDDYLIYQIDNQSYKTGYTLAEDGDVKFTGEPEKVIRKTVYTPMESLQAKYADIVQEVGRRNATLDSARIKKIVELCQELLSSDLPDEKEVKKAAKEADKALAWIKEQSLMKTEDNEKFPSQAFAYTPDIENPDTWGVRLHETTDSGLTKQQLAKASASLSPGGYRGIKASVPVIDLPSVKRTIRMGYRAIGIDESDIPKWVKGVETREPILTFTPLTEAKFEKGRATVIVIKPGFNASEDRYYPKEMLKRDYKVFEGMKMFADHPTDEEEKSRPERSMRSDWVAVLKDVTCDESGIVTGVAEIVEPWLMQKLATLRDKELLSEMGVSINAVGSATKATIDNKETLVIEKLVGCRSVDFVTEPGAGGIVTFYESDRNRDVDLIELSGLKERRPDLVSLIEADIKAEITKEVKHKVELEDKVKELEGQVETLTTENTTLKTSISEAEKAKLRADAQAAVKEAVDKAELPGAAKERLIERFKDAESVEGIEEAIQSEKDYIAKLSESSKVKGMGPSKVDPEVSHKELTESFKALGMTDDQAEIAARG